MVSNAENDQDFENKSNGYGVGIFIRKYKPIGHGGFYVFLQGGLNGSHIKQESDGPLTTYDDEIKRFTIGINANPGISFAVSKKMHLETGFNNIVSLTYFNEKRGQSNGSNTAYKSNGFSVSSSLSNATSSLYLGFRLLIGK